MDQPFLIKIQRVLHRRGLIISSLLFLILGAQLMVLLPENIESLDNGIGNVSAKPETKATLNDSPLIENGLGDSKAGQVIRGIHSVEVNADGLGWELWAKRGQKLKNSDEWQLETVKVKFYASDGVFYIVTGNEGGVNPSSFDLWIKGRVVTNSSNGYRFESPTVKYNSNVKRLYANDAVKMISPKDKKGGVLELSGVHMFADMNTNELQISQSVVARRTIDRSRQAQIRSHEAYFSGLTNSAIFKGDVIMDIESIRATGPEARFVYGAGSDTLQSIYLLGGVKVTDANRLATSGTLLVDFDEDRYVFKGTPRVRQNGDELIGDEIIFLNGGKQIQVINAKAEVDPLVQEQDGEVIKFEEEPVNKPLKSSRIKR